MDTIESTPEMATAPIRDARAQHRGRAAATPATAHVVGESAARTSRRCTASGPRPGKSYLILRPDRVVLQDVLGQTAMLQFMQTQRDQVAVPTTIHCDHLDPGAGRRRSGLASVARRKQRNIRIPALSGGPIPARDFGEPGAGIIHQVVLENYAFPGELIIGTDSHTPNSGGLGACAIGVGGADAVEVIAGLRWEVLYPRRIAIVLTGKLTTGRRRRTSSFTLPGNSPSPEARTLSSNTSDPVRARSVRPERRLSPIWALSFGATTSIFPADERTCEYLQATRRGDLVPIVERYRSLLNPIPRSRQTPNVLLRSHTRDQSLQARTARRRTALSRSGAAGLSSPPRFPTRTIRFAIQDLDRVIGSCTNSSYEDMSRAADIAEQARAHGAESGRAAHDHSGSRRSAATIERDGQMRSLNDIGGTVLANACGPCIGQWRRTDARCAEHDRHLLQSELSRPQRRQSRP